MDPIDSQNPPLTFAERVCAHSHLRLGLFVVVLMLCLGQAISLHAPTLIKHTNGLTDFNAFYLTGKMVWAGQAKSAYDWQFVKAAQFHTFGATSFMPWSYLPPFTAFVALLALLPMSVSYLIYTAATFLFFDHVLKKLSGRYAPGAMTFALPAILVNARCGQNGFLTAALIGSFLLLYRERSWKAGWSLGTMLVKPHLAGAICLLALLSRQWGAIFVAAGVVVVTSLITSLALGPDIWMAFFQSIHATGEFLWHGLYPLERMTSVYAGLYALGVTAPVALFFHAAVAVAAVVALAMAWRKRILADHLLALTAVTSLLISPYNYDYDLVILSLAAGLVLPDILARAKGWEVLALGLLGWVSSFNAWVIIVHNWYYGEELMEGSARLATVSPFALLLLIAFVVLILRRRLEGEPVPVSYRILPSA